MNRIPLSNNRKFLLKYIASYSSLLIIILLMGLYLYKLGIDDAKSNLFEQSRAILSQSVNDMDSAFRVMDALSCQIAENSNIIKLEKAPSSEEYGFYLYALEAMQFLNSFRPSETILPISDYYIYLPRTDYLLSSTYFNRTDLYYRMNKAYHTDYYKEWLSVLNDKNSTFSFYETFHFTEKETSFYLYIVPIESYTMKTNTEVPGVICFEIDKNKLSEIFANLSFFDHGFLYVVDSQGNNVFSVAENTPDISSDKLLSLIKQVNDDSHFSKVSFQKEDMIVTSIVSSYNQWTYYLFQPEAMALRALLSYQKLYTLIVVGACIISFILILLLSKRNVAPIIKIRTQLEDTLKEHSSLQQTLESQKQIIYQSYIDRLITGRVHNEDELNYISHYLKICTLNRKFCVLSITAYYVNDTSDSLSNDVLFPPEYTTYQQTLMREFYEAFGKETLIHEASPTSFALLVNCDRDMSFEDTTALVAGQFLIMQKRIVEKYPFYLFCGMGNQNEDLSYTWKSYQQSLQAVACASHKAPFQAYKKLDKSVNGYYYPLEFAQKLTEFITSGSEKQVQESFHLIEHENKKERTLTPQMYQLLFSDIRNTLLKIRFTITDKTLEAPAQETLLEQIDSALELPTLNFAQLSETALKLTSLYKPKQQEGNKLILTIQEYIRNNYVDSSLCLNKISDEFGISESYFSYLFKAETKTNFSEYLENLRMEQALILLETTSIPISNLYVEVGYNNANSFRRAFKKVHGASPKAIRDSLKQKQL